MNKKAYQSPTLTILGEISNSTLGSGTSAHDNGNPSANANGS
jgi:hypothetical protein